MAQSLWDAYAGVQAQEERNEELATTAGPVVEQQEVPFTPAGGGNFESEFSKGTRRRMPGLRRAFGETAQAFGEVTGIEPAAEYGQDLAARAALEERTRPELAARVPTFEEARGAGDLADWFAAKAGESTADIALGVGGAIAGGVAGGPVGAVAGASAALFPTHFGGNVAEARDVAAREGVELESDIYFRAGIGALQQTVADIVGPGFFLTKLMPREVKKAIGRRVADAAGYGAVTEGATEAFQEYVTVKQVLENSVPGYQMSDEEYYARLKEAGLAGAALGGAFGGVGGLAAPVAVEVGGGTGFIEGAAAGEEIPDITPEELQAARDSFKVDAARSLGVERDFTFTPEDAALLQVAFDPQAPRNRWTEAESFRIHQAIMNSPNLRPSVKKALLQDFYARLDVIDESSEASISAREVAERNLREQTDYMERDALEEEESQFEIPQDELPDQDITEYFNPGFSVGKVSGEVRDPYAGAFDPRLSVDEVESEDAYRAILRPAEIVEETPSIGPEEVFGPKDQLQFGPQQIPKPRPFSKDEARPREFLVHTLSDKGTRQVEAVDAPNLVARMLDKISKDEREEQEETRADEAASPERVAQAFAQGMVSMLTYEGRPEITPIPIPDDLVLYRPKKRGEETAPPSITYGQIKAQLRKDPRGAAIQKLLAAEETLSSTDRRTRDDLLKSMRELAGREMSLEQRNEELAKLHKKYFGTRKNKRKEVEPYIASADEFFQKAVADRPTLLVRKGQDVQKLKDYSRVYRESYMSVDEIKRLPVQYQIPIVEGIFAQYLDKPEVNRKTGEIGPTSATGTNWRAMVDKTMESVEESRLGDYRIPAPLKDALEAMPNVELIRKWDQRFSQYTEKFFNGLVSSEDYEAAMGKVIDFLENAGRVHIDIRNMAAEAKRSGTVFKEARNAQRERFQNDPDQQYDWLTEEPIEEVWEPEELSPAGALDVGFYEYRKTLKELVVPQFKKWAKEYDKADKKGKDELIRKAVRRFSMVHSTPESKAKAVDFARENLFNRQAPGVKRYFARNTKVNIFDAAINVLQFSRVGGDVISLNWSREFSGLMTQVENKFGIAAGQLKAYLLLRQRESEEYKTWQEEIKLNNAAQEKYNTTLSPEAKDELAESDKAVNKAALNARVWIEEKSAELAQWLIRAPDIHEGRARIQRLLNAVAESPRKPIEAIEAENIRRTEGPTFLVKGKVWAEAWKDALGDPKWEAGNLSAQNITATSIPKATDPHWRVPTKEQRKELSQTDKNALEASWVPPDQRTKTPSTFTLTEENAEETLKKAGFIAPSRTVVDEYDNLETVFDEYAADEKRINAKTQRVFDRWSKRLKMDKVKVVSSAEFEAILEQEQDYSTMYDLSTGAMDGGAFIHDGVVNIWINPKLTGALRREIMAHEFGHAIYKSEFQHISKADAKAIYDAHEAWKKKHGKGSLLDLLKSKKTEQAVLQEIARGVGTRQVETMSEADRQYVLDFEEWFADEVSKTLTNDSTLTGAAKNFFKRLVAKLKALFGVQTFYRDVDHFVASLSARGGIFTDINLVPTVRTLETKFGVAAAMSTEVREKIERKLGKSADELFIPDQFRAENWSWFAGSHQREEDSTAMMAMFNELVKELSQSQKLVLQRAATSTYVQRQMVRELGNTERAQKLVQEPSVAPGIMYTLWAQKRINVGPQTRGVFGKILQKVRDVWGVLDDEKLAPQLLEKINGGLAEMRAADIGNGQRGIVIVDTRQKNAVRNQFTPLLNRIAETSKSLFWLADSEIRSLRIPALTWMANQFHATAGDNFKGPTMNASRSQQIARFREKIIKVFEGKGKQFGKDVLHVLQNRWDYGNASPEVREGAAQVIAIMNQMKKYFDRYDYPVGDIKNYFPWVFDIQYMEAHKDDFFKLLSQEKFHEELYSIGFNFLTKWIRSEKWANRQLEEENATIEDAIKTMEDLAAQREIDPKKHKASAAFEAAMRLKHIREFSPLGSREPTVNSVIDMLYNMILRNGMDDELDVHDVTHVPAFRSGNTRLLNFISPESKQKLGTKEDMIELQKFFSKDIGLTMDTYVNSAIKKVEYARRFGADGAKLKQKREEAKIGIRDYATRQTQNIKDPAKRKQEFKRIVARTEELVDNYIHAMLGTHGIKTWMYLHRKFGWTGLVPDPNSPGNRGKPISPKLQKVINTIMVYQNVRLLALATVSSLIDPLGIAVRSGSLGLAFEGFRKGIRSVYRSTKGDKDLQTSLGKFLGIVDTNLTNEALGWEYGGVYMTGWQRKVNEGFFTVTGLQLWTRTTRVMAIHAGMRFLAFHKAHPKKHSERWLDELGITPADIKLDQNGEVLILDNAQFREADEAERARDQRVKQAIYRFVDQSILRPNASQRPVWASDQHYALFFHLKSFMYAFHDLYIKRALYELEYDNPMPMMALLSFVPAMMAAEMLRDLIQHLGNGDPMKANWDMSDYILNGITRSGVPGLSMLAFDAKHDIDYGGWGFESFAGPTVQQMLNPDLGKALPGQNLYRGWLN